MCFRFRIAAVMLTFVACLPVNSTADVPCGGCGNRIAELIKQSISDHEAWYQESKAVLLETPTGEWSTDLVNENLDLALKLIYFASNLHEHETGQVARSADELISMSYLSEWPGNPFNGWSPIKIWDISEGFHPGDVALELCPVSYATHGEQLSRQYYIYGENEQAMAPEVVVSKNGEWATKPSGAVATLGIRYLTDSEIEERERQLEAQLAAIQAADEEAAKGGETQ